jgi:hypothetical protein
MLAASDVVFQGTPQSRLDAIVNVVRNLAPDILAVYSHGFRFHRHKTKLESIRIRQVCNLRISPHPASKCYTQQSPLKGCGDASGCFSVVSGNAGMASGLSSPGGYIPN